MSNESRLSRFSFRSPARFFAPSTVPPLPATTRPKSYLYVGVRPPSFQFDSFTRRTMYRPAPVPDIFFQASSGEEPAGRLTTDTFAPALERPSLIMPESTSTKGSLPGRSGAIKDGSGIPNWSRMIPSNLGPFSPETTYGRASITPTARFFSAPLYSLGVSSLFGTGVVQAQTRKTGRIGNSRFKARRVFLFSSVVWKTCIKYKTLAMEIAACNLTFAPAPARGRGRWFTKARCFSPVAVGRAVRAQAVLVVRYRHNQAPKRPEERANMIRPSHAQIRWF